MFLLQKAIVAYDGWPGDPESERFIWCWETLDQSDNEDQLRERERDLDFWSTDSDAVYRVVSEQEAAKEKAATE